MYEKTQAIVLHLTRHTDKLSILHLYTDRLGRADCMVSNPQVRRSGVRSALLTPLSLIEAELFQRAEGQPLRLRSAGLSYIPERLNTDMPRQCIGMFISEILYRSLRRPLPDEELFGFLSDTIRQLDTAPHVANLHLIFLIQLSRHLGFVPNMEQEGNIFDMQDGIRRTVRPLHPNFMDAHDTQLLADLCSHTYQDMHLIRMTRHERQHMLRRLEEYYKLHVADFYGTRSIDVLTELFD